MAHAPGVLNGTAAAAAGPRGGVQYELRLYISGMTARSGDAIATVTAVCDRCLAGRYSLDVIDIYEHPELAAQANIKVAPTVVRVQPAPQRRLVGDLADEGCIISRLGLPPSPGSPTPDQERVQ